MRGKFGSGLAFAVVACVIAFAGLNAYTLWVFDRAFDAVKNSTVIVRWLQVHVTINYLIVAGLFGIVPMVGLLSIVARRMTSRKQDQSQGK